MRLRIIGSPENLCCICCIYFVGRLYNSTSLLVVGRTSYMNDLISSSLAQDSSHFLAALPCPLLSGSSFLPSRNAKHDRLVEHRKTDNNGCSRILVCDVTGQGYQWVLANRLLLRRRLSYWTGLECRGRGGRRERASMVVRNRREGRTRSGRGANAWMGNSIWNGGLGPGLV